MSGGFNFQSHPSPLTTKRRGEIAEAAFLHKAASLGFSVAKPWGESPFDSFPLRGQSLRAGSPAPSTDTASTPAATRSTPSRFAVSRSGQAQPHTPRDIDFIVGYVVPGDVWYVIPIEAYGERTTIKVFPSSRRRMSRFEKYREAWEYFRLEREATALAAP